MSYIAFVLIMIGFAFIVSGIIGLFRFQDFYTKIHAAGVIEACGAPLCFAGLSLIQSDVSSSFKLILIALLMFLLNPVSTHAIARWALNDKLDKNGRLK